MKSYKSHQDSKESFANERVVSIVCPLFDKQKYIAETITSVLAQRYQAWELIIIDDGSTDKSMEIVRGFDDSRIKLFERKDFSDKRGASVCRNVGIHEAKGDYILFLDADDMLKPHCLITRMKYVSDNPASDFYIFNIERFLGSKDKVVKTGMINNVNKLLYYLALNKRQFFLNKFLKYSSQWSICNPLWKKSALERINGFNENFQRLQDPEIHTRALLEDLSFKFIKYDFVADVSVRNDIDRRNTITQIQMYGRIAISLEQYVNTFYELLMSKGLKKKLKFLNCYIILIEQITAGYYNSTLDADEKMAILNRRDEFYKNLVFKGSRSYQIFKKLYRFLASSSILRKLRIPAVSIYIYKAIL